MDVMLESQSEEPSETSVLTEETRSENSSESVFLPWSEVPTVVFVEIMRKLSGEEVERCRLISREFYTRIENSRERISPVEVSSLTILQSTNWENAEENPADDQIKVRFGIEREHDKKESFEREFEYLTLDTVKSRLAHCCRRIKLREFNVNHVTSKVLLSVIDELACARVTCEVVCVDIDSRELDEENDLMTLLRWLTPKAFVLKSEFVVSPITSSFFVSDCFHSVQELHIQSASGSQELNDEVLEKTSFRILNVRGGSGVTVDGIVKYFESWKAGSRKLQTFNLTTEGDGETRNRLLRSLPWTLPITEPGEDGLFDYTVENKVINDAGKAITLAISLSFPQQLKIRAHYHDFCEFPCALFRDHLSVGSMSDDIYGDEYISGDDDDNSDIDADFDIEDHMGPEEYDYDVYDEDYDLEDHDDLYHVGWE